jgi:hypothetical protein
MLIRIIQVDDDPALLRVKNYIMDPGTDGLAPMASDTNVLVLREPGNKLASLINSRTRDNNTI